MPLASSEGLTARLEPWIPASATRLAGDLGSEFRIPMRLERVKPRHTSNFFPNSGLGYLPLYYARQTYSRVATEKYGTPVPLATSLRT